MPESASESTATTPLSNALVADEHGVIRLIADTRSERQVALLKAALGVVLIPCAAYLLLVPALVTRLFGAAGAVFGLLWLARGIATLRTRPTRDRQPQDGLELGPEGLWVCERGIERRLAWREIAAIAIDEDRLTLALLHEDGEVIHVEPRYRGVTLQDLCNTARALHSSR